MGKAHRRRRAEEKRLARWFGYKENEHGELVKKTTKAEARRRFVRAEEIRRQAEADIIDAACKKAHDEICAQVDREVFEDTSNVINDIPDFDSM
jgi:hypothetical protein